MKDYEKIIRVKTSKKPKIGYNSLWLIRCKSCNEIILRWDTELYNKPCPCCKDNDKIKLIMDKEEIKENIFRIQKRLYSEYKTNNVLTAKEISLLSSFRETCFKRDLKDLISDYFFRSREYTIHRKVEWKISKRGEQLLKNPDFMDLLKECYLLLDKEVL